MGVRRRCLVSKRFVFAAGYGVVLVPVQVLGAGPEITEGRFPGYHPSHTVIKCPYLPPGLVDIPTCGDQKVTCLGTAASDMIRGTEGDDVILALGGDDVVIAREGNDTVCGGLGDDEIHGNKGLDVLIGERGDDTFFGGQLKGRDRARGVYHPE